MKVDRFGLPPIGMPHADMNTTGSDTERRAFPGLATKSSVFAWQNPFPTLYAPGTVTGAATVTINLRNNTATGGASVDVPTWSAGAVIGLAISAQIPGTSTYFKWTVSSPLVPTYSAIEVGSIGVAVADEQRQIVVPFFDEPLFQLTRTTNGDGSYSIFILLQGFVRNV